MNLAEFQEKQRDWMRRCNNAVANAPAIFQDAFENLSTNDLDAAERGFAQCALSGSLTGNSLAILAWISEQRRDYQEAIEFTKQANRQGITLIGCYYYYNALSSALNQTDNLRECLKVLDEGIGEFMKEDVPSQVAVLSCQKANVLKQLAAVTSKSLDLSEREQAKHDITWAIRYICVSLEITSVGWEEEVKGELEAIARIAARAGVRARDLAFLDDMAEIRTITERYFDDLNLQRTCSSELFNLAQQAKKEGRREDAAVWFDRAVESAIEKEPWDKAWKAFLAYQAGVNLLYQFGLEDPSVALNSTGPVKGAVRRIQDLWKEVLELNKQIDSQTRDQFDTNLAPGLSAAVENIEKDRIMWWADTH